jgi:hypothetical protein
MSDINLMVAVVSIHSLRNYLFDWWLSLQPPAHAGSSLPDFSTLKMEAIRSPETSVHTRSTRRHIPEYGILLVSLHFMRIVTTQPTNSVNFESKLASLS